MLNDFEKISLRYYEKRLALSKWRYIFFYGVLGWGIPVAITVTIVDMYLDKKSVTDMLAGEFWISLACFMIGGLVVGLITRKIIEKKYKKLKEKEQLPG